MNSDDRIYKKLLEHDEKFDKMATSKELHTFKDAIARSLDEMTIILKRLDEERIFTAKWIERVEKDVESNSREIKRMKLQLKIAQKKRDEQERFDTTY